MADEIQREELTAYLDGEMGDADAQALEERLAKDARLRAELDSLRKAWELLDFLPHPEPSANFTSRTLDKISVVRPSVSESAAATLVAPTGQLPVPLKRPWLARLGWIAAALVLFLLAFVGAGSIGKRGLSPEDPAALEEQLARDLRVVDNLPLYQFADEYAFLLALDQPDLFGEDSGN